ncbi:hypothetical protein OPV22_009220 [Ensete ventricosum]|uniref:aldehyde oxygenase (deformylating) n=1 Tax=Ensete ventricosum TaxID=4639 RepID=A0AAV8R4P8_ENSVE|nr:hypothetical protein OPV22_009220 [Ensete ventricosum]
MASQPGPLTQWPWQRLGNMKYAVLAPWLAHSVHKFMTGKPEERDMINILVIPSLLMRLLHAQLWITLSRMKTANSKHSIVDKSLDFEQVDRERNWDDQIILTAILAYVVNKVIPGASHLPWWSTRGAILMCLLHVGPVEFLYYWFHRALHHHFLYSRYHSHHHASVVTEPITSVIHPFAEELVYFLLFAIPPITTALTGSASIITTYGYLNYIDFMNYMGHCNFEMVPKWLLDSLPPLKYLMYTPSFHSLHHTRFRTNYSLFMPIYDYIYGTVDESSDELHERSLRKKEEMVDVVHLTHLTTLQSMYHSRIGLSSLASKPYEHQWYLWIFWPFTHALVQLAWHIGTTFTVERNKLEKLRMETWMMPRYSFQYATFAEKEKINGLIEEAILEADKRGAKVLSLGLLNQGDELNGCGMLYVKRNPKLKVRIVDGTSLAVAVVLNSIPKGTQSVLLLVGNVSKMALSLCLALCQIDIQVEMVQRDKFNLLKQRLPSSLQNHLVLSGKYKSKTWLLGNGVSDQEQRKAREGIHFIPYSQFPPRVVREDCIYHCTPALLVPNAYQNLHACENWLPRRVMSAWRVAGIVHALEQWNKNECGETVSNIETMWRAALRHGFLPYDGVL